MYSRGVTAIFQSTLPRRERLPCSCLYRLRRYFNPRSREGSDVCACRDCLRPGISIHAPAKGATGSIDTALTTGSNFNPRSREGSDKILAKSHHRGTYFNPRSREGSDTVCRLYFPPSLYFNPRSREGSDSKDKQKICISLVRTTIFLWRDLGATAPGHQKNKDKSKILKHG